MLVRWLCAAAALLVIVGSAGDVAAQLTDDELTRYRRQLENGNIDERVAAADALGRRGASRRDDVVPLLRRQMRADEAWQVRASSGRALGRLNARNAVPELVRGLRDPVVDVRIVSAAALWRLPDPAAVPPLLELLRDQEAAARQWAALALGVIRDRRATRPLISLLRDPEESVRMDAIRSLGRLRDPTSLQSLYEFIQDEEQELDERLEAINSISQLDGPTKQNRLIRLIGHDDENVRLRAVQALGRVGDALVVPALRQQRAAESESSVRSAIDEAIADVQGRAGGQGGGVPLNLPD